MIVIALILSTGANVNTTSAALGDSCTSGGRAGTEDALGACIQVPSSSSSLIVVFTNRIAPGSERISIADSIVYFPGEFAGYGNVKLQWLTNQFTNSYVEIYKDGQLQRVEDANYGTGHTSIFTLQAGNYSAVIVSYGGYVRSLPLLLDIR